MDFAGLTRAASVGLSTPTAVGDFEIAFSRIASDLKDALSILGDFNNATASQTRRTELASALYAFQQMVNLGRVVDDNLANIERQGKIIDAETLRKQQAESSKATLTQLRDSKQEQINKNTSDITAYNKNISDLWAEDTRLLNERATLDPKKSADAIRIAQIDIRRGQIPGDISYWNGLITQRSQSSSVLQSEINSLNAQIGTLQGTIDDATGKISAADSSRTESRIIVRDTRFAMSNFYDATTIMMKLALSKTVADIAGDAGKVDATGGQFDRLIQSLAAALLDLGALLSESAIDKDVALGEGSGAGLNLDVSSPGRFGQPNATVARSIAFAGMVAGVLGAVSDLLNGLRQGLGMQTAESFANAGTSRVRVGL